jgi:putrescine transport system substrate-binding protein
VDVLSLATLRACLSFLFIILFVCLGAYYLFAPPQSAPSEEEPYLNIYNWYAMIPPEVLEQFEQETGIAIRYDLYDNNEIVEAKLLTGNSGFDIVFPSASPYIATQISVGAYEKLNKDLIPNLKYIDPLIYEQMRVADPDLAYAIPYYWGTFGFAYVEEEINKRLPNAPKHSLRMLFDPEVVKHFSSCGVTLLDEAVDVYPAMLRYQKKDSHSASLDDLEEAHQKLLKVRPYINRFSSSRFVNELVAGESCIAQAWSGEAQLAHERAREVGKNINIRYVIPEEGAALWIDAIVIPKGAPHLKNAHQFINFLFRPEISAAVAKYTKLGITNTAAFPLLDPDMKQDETIFPKPEVMAKLKLDKNHAQDYERHRTRLWTQFRIGKKAAQRD